ncbi:hypothetical protein ILFOPFJJ_00077 [Ensifer psoraleae]|uniref:hypothetical protein n=1 Tax=Sinorhizobium psoraleae TaxID=520838 RepID=UPI001568BCAD|nr:hypothetical protein [Sinorhizobium psoraleae]NRP69213.1 hypothetical protein [Sinorhizobium psoraleae]
MTQISFAELVKHFEGQHPGHGERVAKELAEAMAKGKAAMILVEDGKPVVGLEGETTRH